MPPFNLKNIVNQLGQDPEKQETERKKAQELRVAIEGCAHGQLNKIYEECLNHQKITGKKIDLLICCGDFQGVRGGIDLAEDLASMSIPEHHKDRNGGDFPDYFSGRRRAPILTIIIGGNHEASNFLFSQYYGGQLCHNIYYLGHSGVINVGGLRIAGLSGIYKVHDFLKGYPVPPYRDENGRRDESAIKSAFHVRAQEIRKLEMLHSHVNLLPRSLGFVAPAIDIFLSHDWPEGIYKHGDTEELLEKKKYFAEDIARGTLGNPKSMELLKLLKPRYWFSAHLHVRFKATVAHVDQAKSEYQKIIDSLPNSASNSQQPSPASSQQEQQQQQQQQTPTPTPIFKTKESMFRVSKTEFLALDKCVKERETNRYLEVFTISPANDYSTTSLGPEVGRDPFTGDLVVYYDPHWLEIIKATHRTVPLMNVPTGLPGRATCKVDWIAQSVGQESSTQQERRFREEQQQQQQQQQQQHQQQVVVFTSSQPPPLKMSCGGSSSSSSVISSQNNSNNNNPSVSVLGSLLHPTLNNNNAVTTNFSSSSSSQLQWIRMTTTMGLLRELGLLVEQQQVPPPPRQQQDSASSRQQQQTQVHREEKKPQQHQQNNINAVEDFGWSEDI